MQKKLSIALAELVFFGHDINHAKKLSVKNGKFDPFWPFGRFFQYENKLLPIKTMHILDLVTLIFSAKKKLGS